MQEPDLKSLDSYRVKGIRPNVVCCFVQDGKVLMVYKKEHDLWQIPQGGVENGELLLDAIKRETLEELGFSSPSSFNLIGEATLDFPRKTYGVKELRTDDGKEVLMTGKHYFYCAIPVTNISVKLNTTQFDAIKWMSYEEARSLIATSDSAKLPGKKRITLDIINCLYKEKWIK